MWLWLSKPFWDPTFGVGAPPILEPIVVRIGMFAGGVRDFDPWPDLLESVGLKKLTASCWAVWHGGVGDFWEVNARAVDWFMALALRCVARRSFGHLYTAAWPHFQSFYSRSPPGS